MSHHLADPESAQTPWRGDWRWTAGKGGCLAAQDLGYVDVDGEAHER